MTIAPPMRGAEGADALRGVDAVVKRVLPQSGDGAETMYEIGVTRARARGARPFPRWYSLARGNSSR